MSTTKKILTVFGATGNQGGSVLDVVLSRSDLTSKYALRGITRDVESAKSQALTAKGVEMVQADLDDETSLKAAMDGAYGAFGVTDFWSTMSKDTEIQQGKNIFHAAQASGVKHLVFSALPYAEKITDGKLKHVEHFDSKAIVKEYIEANKGEMLASYFMPAMFLQEAKKQIQAGQDGNPALSMPFPDENIAWPMIDPRSDTGKYVLGLFEVGEKANGVFVHGVSVWTTPKDFVTAIGTSAGREVKFNVLPPEVYASFLPDVIKSEISEMMALIGHYSYFGKNQERQQSTHDKWLLEGTEKLTLEKWAENNKPWEF